MNWKLTKTLFIFVFILVNIFLVIVYIDKVNKSQVNDSEKVNEVNFQQEEIDVRLLGLTMTNLAKSEETIQLSLWD